MQLVTVFTFRSRIPSESTPEEQSGSTGEVEAQPQILFNKSLFSGEESEDDEQAEDIDLSATPWHPKPLGVSAEKVVQCNSSLVCLF